MFLCCWVSFLRSNRCSKGALPKSGDSLVSGREEDSGVLLRWFLVRGNFLTFLCFRSRPFRTCVCFFWRGCLSKSQKKSPHLEKVLCQSGAFVGVPREQIDTVIVSLETKPKSTLATLSPSPKQLAPTTRSYLSHPFSPHPDNTNSYSPSKLPRNQKLVPLFFLIKVVLKERKLCRFGNVTHQPS